MLMGFKWNRVVAYGALEELLCFSHMTLSQVC